MTFTHAFPRDLETEGHVMFYVTFALLSLLVFVLPQWFCCCFVRILDQEIHSNYRCLRGLHAWPWNWMSRRGLRDICNFCLYLCYRNDFVCFVRFLGQRIHSNYCHSLDSHLWPWNSGLRHGVRDICYFWALVCVLQQWFFVFSGFEVKEFILTIAICMTITCDLET